MTWVMMDCSMEHSFLDGAGMGPLEKLITCRLLLFGVPNRMTLDGRHSY